MFGIFKRNNGYKKRTDGKSWTKNTALASIANELAPLNPLIQGNTLWFDDRKTIGVEFIADNYSTDDTNLSLNASVFFKLDDGTFFTWTDLFNQAKATYGDSYRALEIHRDEEWDGSRIQKECQEVFLPFLGVILDSKKRQHYLKGEKVEFMGKTAPRMFDDPQRLIQHAPWVI